MIGDHRANGRERGVSVAITHVLTIGITTILIAMLMMTGSTLLETETERSADRSLETIGERIADEIENVHRIGSNGDPDSVTLTVEHPRTVANTGYRVTLLDEGNCDGPLIEANVDCLELAASDTDVAVQVPVAAAVDLEDGESATGGTIEISYDTTSDTITIEGAN